MSDITGYLNQSLVMKSKTGFDEQGKPNLGLSVSFKGRFREVQKKIIDYKGNEYMTDAECWLEPTNPIKLDDLVVYEAINYKVIKIDVRRSLEGTIHHKKILLIKTT